MNPSTRNKALAVVAATGLAFLAWARGKSEGMDLNPENDRRDPHENNTWGLPDGRPIQRALEDRFAAQLKETLGTLPEIGHPLPNHLDAPHDAEEMAAVMTPLLSAYWDESGRVTRARLGLDPETWRVTNPHTQGAIQAAAFAFCAETNRTTSTELEDARQELRDELAEGLVAEGEAIPQLRKRVQKVYERASDTRANVIARTEASRAVHAASFASARTSGVVQGKKWLLSANSCPLCVSLAEAVPEGGVPVDASFGHVGTNPEYSDIVFPPGHPHCRCSVTYVLTDEYIQYLDESSPPSESIEPGPLGPDPRPKRPYPFRLADHFRKNRRAYKRMRSLQSLLPGHWPGLSKSRPKPSPVAPATEPAPPASAKPIPPIAALLRDYVVGDEIVQRLANLDQEYRREREKLEGVYETATKAFLKAQRAGRGEEPATKDLGSHLQAVEEARRAFEDLRRAIPALVAHLVARTDAPPASITSKLRPTHPAAAAIVAGELFLARTLAADAAHPKGIRINYARARGKNGRASYVEARQQVWVADYDDESTVVHEIGHAIEHQWEEVGEAARQFLRYRVGRERNKSLAKLFPEFGYDPWETGRKDRFDEAFDLRYAYYVGKDYRSKAGATIYSTEILSMGLQKLMTDPVGFAVRDPEYCKFVVGVLRGDIRMPIPPKPSRRKPKPETGIGQEQEQEADLESESKSLEDAGTSSEEPVGSVAFAWRGRQAVATLGDDLRWTVAGTSEPLDQVFNILFGVPVEPSPCLGAPGVLQLHAAAETLGGVVSGVIRFEGRREGVVY